MAKSTTTRSPDDEDFDLCANDYEKQLNKGLSMSGETKDFFALERILWLQHILRKFDYHPMSCLDFGCGTGTATPYFYNNLSIQSVTGTDPSAASLQVATTDWGKMGANFILPDALPEAQFDLGFCNGVFHHIDPSNRGQAVTQVFKSLKSGGYFAFWENNPWNPLTRLAMSRVPFDADAIMLWPWQARRILKDGGFEIVTTNYRFFFPKAMAAFRWLEPTLRHCVMGAQYLVLARKP